MPTSGIGFQPALQQYYSTLAGQPFPVNFDVCQYQQIYATIYVDSTKSIGNGYQTLIQDALIALNNQFPIGNRVSSEQVLNGLTNFSAATITGATLATSPSGTYGQIIGINQNCIPFFTASGINVVLV
jgi:hypothetical protein